MDLFFFFYFVYQVDILTNISRTSICINLEDYWTELHSYSSDSPPSCPYTELYKLQILLYLLCFATNGPTLTRRLELNSPIGKITGKPRVSTYPHFSLSKVFFQPNSASMHSPISVLALVTVGNRTLKMMFSPPALRYLGNAYSDQCLLEISHRRDRIVPTLYFVPGEYNHPGRMRPRRDRLKRLHPMWARLLCFVCYRANTLTRVVVYHLKCCRLGEGCEVWLE